VTAATALRLSPTGTALPQVTYTVTDGRSNGTTSAILTLSVTPVADAHNDTASTHAGVPVTIDVLANDTFSNADKAITATTDGQNGTVAISTAGRLYPDRPGYVGTDTFTYTVTSGGVNETATVTVTVTNSAPELTPEQVTTPEDTPLAGGSTWLLAHASDPDGDALA
jgi:hypothetical protein